MYDMFIDSEPSGSCVICGAPCNGQRECEDCANDRESLDSEDFLTLLLEKQREMKYVLNRTILKETRIARGFSQTHLGNLLNLDYNTIARYESLTTDNISLLRINELAEALDVKPSALVREIQNDCAE